MRLGKSLSRDFPTIINIRKIGKNIIGINFKFSFDANNFVEKQNYLPNNWISYISDYKIFRSGVKSVNISLTDEEILQGIKCIDNLIEMKSISKLKYRDKSNNNELRDSSSVKIKFLSNLLLEFISIWSVRLWVRPFIYKIRRC